MQWALEQYNEKRTTMAESIKHDNELDYPIFVFCPEPGFKPSFFKKMKGNEPGMENFIWRYTSFWKNFLQQFSSIPDAYENMSHIFGVDWSILLLPLSQDDR